MINVYLRRTNGISPFVVAILMLVSSMDAPANASQSWISGKDDCQSWQAKYHGLSAEQRVLIQRYGVIRTGEWILSPDIVRDCAIRVTIEVFLRDAVAGRSELIDQEFIKANRLALFRVLKRIWPIMGNSSAVPSDGAFNSEKWGILRNARFDEQQMAELLRESLKIERISPDFVSFFLDHPNPRLAQDFKRILRRERNASSARDRTMTTQLYCLALLYSIHEVDGIHNWLVTVANDERATKTEKIVANQLRELMAQRRAVSWADLEALEVP